MEPMQINRDWIVRLQEISRELEQTINTSSYDELQMKVQYLCGYISSIDNLPFPPSPKSGEKE